MATLQDIADVVGVSSVTVSKVLRGKIKGSFPSSAARAERIREVADEMGYRVDWRARALKTRRTHMIGLLTTDKPETHNVDGRVLNGLIETFGQAGYHLVLVRIRKGTNGSDFADARFDGIVIDYHLEPEELEIIHQAKLPAVVINAPGPDDAVSVMPDHFAAGSMAAQHLLDLGHRRIGLVQASLAEQARWPQHMVAMWREGIRSTLRHAGLLDQFTDIVPDGKPGGETSAEFLIALRKALSHPGRPTALIVNNPIRAAGKVLPNFEALGLSCPQDLSLLTMEEMQELGWCRPGLTSINIPFDRLGTAAARQLLSLIENDAEPPFAEMAMTSNLVLRDSTAPPPENVVLARAAN